jgi:hypothetical protein
MKLFSKLMVFTGLLLFIFTLNNCDTPMGFGDPIDWDPPELYLDKSIESPMYVNNNARIFGTVYDNVDVDRVIMRDSLTGEQLFQATLTRRSDNGYDWEIILSFTQEQNGEQISAEVVAYDTSGNSGDTSIVFVTLIIDVRPPVIEDIWVERAPGRPQAYLLPYNELKALETTDPNGHRIENVDKYQNGYFTIAAYATEDETSITSITLNISDQRHPGITLYSAEVPANQNKNFPKWVINEDILLTAGDALLPIPDYKNTYHNDKNARYYYRVTVTAVDKSKNENQIRQEDVGFICMWAYADTPKGILDPVIVGDNPDLYTISRGTPLPVEFFDDDVLANAFAALLTKDQWDGLKPIGAGGTDFLTGASNEQKLANLRTRLIAGTPTYNWRRDKYSESNDSNLIKNHITAADIDITEKKVFIETSNNENDYGDFVLFILVSDKKGPPHPAGIDQGDTSLPWTIRNRWAEDQAYNIQIIDESAPLIVFDTSTITPRYDPAISSTWQNTGYSPEENTFPSPLIESKFFDISGYTLREDSNNANEVKQFRMAWIPAGMEGGADAYITKVQNALKDNYPASFTNDSDLDGVQHWQFLAGNGSSRDHFVTHSVKDNISGNLFRRQIFRKRFNILEDFRYKGELENRTKLFIFYAEDNMGHIVFRQLRILGNTTPPDLAIYDITGEPPVLPGGIPDPTNFYSGSVFNQATYDTALLNYNKQANVYNALKDFSINASNDLIIGQDTRTQPFQSYPRGTTLKYWIMAQRAGDLDIQDIKMTDITTERPGKEVGSGFNSTNKAHSFTEYYPDETQRVFLFEATDTLGNIARIQRTIAITNAARLDNITTTTQNGTYGIGEVITLSANFSGQVSINQTGTRPKLNIRYQRQNGGNIDTVYEAIECEPFTGSSLSLKFNFTVNENFVGQLETLYEDIVKFPGRTGDDLKPIKLESGAQIIDVIRNAPAFVPGYITGNSSMTNWTTVQNALQHDNLLNPNGKIINLYGIRPVLQNISIQDYGKPVINNEYYYKGDETITIRITANKPIYTSASNPGLSFRVMRPAGTGAGSGAEVPSTGFYRFNYSRPAANAMDFTFNVNTDNIQQDFVGFINQIFLAEYDRIADQYGNQFAANVRNNAAFTTQLGAATRIYIDQRPPDKPVARLVPAAGTSTEIGANPDTTLYFNTGRSLEIVPPNTSQEAYFDRSEYSFDGGLTWNTWTTNVSVPTGPRIIQTRHVDKAGNISETTNQSVHINDTFPKLVSVNSGQPNGTYRSGNLFFSLVFDDTVTITNNANVTLTLTNRNTTANNTSNHNTGAGAVTTPQPSYQIQLLAVAGQTNTTSINFTWTNIIGKEMLNGAYVSSINMTGLTDRFGNTGGTGTATSTGAGNASIITVTGAGATTAPNLSSGLIVDGIPPRVNTMAPANSNISTDNRTITITFNENVMKGIGTITVKPRGNYAIPSVFRDEGYWLGTDGVTEYYAPGANRTYIPSLYEIYNNSALTAADRNALAEGTTAASANGNSSVLDNANPSLTRLRLNVRTGQNVGPYVKTTHGLISGPGYTGSYTNATGANGPNPDTSAAGARMIPDISTKWVLDFRYGINDNNTVVNNIRTALNKAKFRWQEIDVVNTAISGNVVTITLNEPLLRGLQWELSYPAGTFTDVAGNNAPVINEGDYWFWSSGVQPPVIRVLRRSSDARGGTALNAGTPTLANLYPTTGDSRTYSVPNDTGGWNNTAFNVTDTTGWGLGNFNNIHYRIESESPGASLTVGAHQGTPGNNGSAFGAWTGTVLAANTGATNINAANWDAAATNTAGEWILPNIIRRSRNNAAVSYTVTTKNGTPEVRNFQGVYRGFRSYNKDLTLTELQSVSRAAQTNGYRGIMTFSALEASKSYVVATANVNSQGEVYGYEGIFRTVIALNGTAGDNNSFIEGSNIKNGMPSIAGFPVRDAEETGDNRFIKLFHRQATGQKLWVSTEIMSEWYLLRWGGGNVAGFAGTHQNVGEVNNYLTVGYGDLTYGYNITTY